MSQANKKVLIMAGGTGGHVFPGIAIANELKPYQVDIHWLGTAGGMEAEWVNKAGLAYSEIAICGLRGKGLSGWLQAPFRVYRAYRQALTILRREQPDLVLGMGGFVCGPGGLAAKKLKISLVLHEQNAIPGFTNRLLSFLAERVLLAFPLAQQSPKRFPRLAQTVVVGNPVRDGLEQIPILSMNDECRLLILGGSRGAQALNQMVPAALAKIPEAQRPAVLHQAGQKTLVSAQEAYAQAGVKAEVVPFIEDMVNAYQQAGLVICRSGALTVSELMASARPAILVPYPHAVDNHQTANAEVLCTLGGGQIMQQAQWNAEQLAQAICNWCQNPEKRTQASLQIRQQAPQMARQQIAQRLLALLQSTET
ncbi:MAG: undecaprenyldiphospho-muramoylpentapeptide beta-N-acetylglucosaminyltransferase [Thiotrichales bacterium]|nr:undecaprenyldiphospho-muramoylpentapeptide beta-N-acetylglucosaminyltransferase [Thiotrichales bacterium]